MAELNHQPAASLTMPDREPDVINDTATAETQTAPTITSARSGPALFDLPAEVWVLIFRHVLPGPDSPPISRFSDPRPVLNILHACRVFYREAFETFYRLAHFQSDFFQPLYGSSQSSRIFAIVRNIHDSVFVCQNYTKLDDFLELVHHFGPPSICRGLLAVGIWIDCRPVRHPLKRFIRALGRFTNFITIDLELWDRLSNLSNNDISHVREYLETALEPVLGPAERLGRRGLRFHPVAHWTFRNRNPDPGDWADVLDGIRLEWDDVTNMDSFKT